MTEISIRDCTAEGSLAYYTIKVKDFIYDGYASTLEGAFEIVGYHREGTFKCGCVSIINPVIYFDCVVCQRTFGS